ncbi:hypothetical protein EVB55_163 [Rhizobium phage RHph_Y68]|uniref:Uncharacterized protein n=1 Tax=Rhizobium phage RHph_Y68 TaxID=2509787 RepID=A0A7S5QY22_9CAUD|nr:hypothetical protein PP934_gp163 [Rhizobium phage RHph_Y68]QIG68098.1 hypothetical protein EVB55_163 [Rhizobium phage RHph_Y68]
MLNIQPKIHTFIFAITNESRDKIYDFAGTYVEAVEKFNKGHNRYPGRCITKVQVIEDQIFGSCVPSPPVDDTFDYRA